MDEKSTGRSQPSKPGDARDGGEFRSGPVVRTALIPTATKGFKALQFAVVDGLAIFEGDIVLGSEAQVRADTEHFRAGLTGQVAMGIVRTGAQFRWPLCVIPYDIDPTLPSQNRVTDAIAHWEANTRYRFVLRTAANAAQYPDWVTFRPAGGCSSNVGRQGGQQFVNLAGGCGTGSTIHEIGHVVGLWHEQSREDRDTFVTIHWDKIQPGFEHNFNQHITDGDDVGAYDYGSIMHYPRTAFSVDGSDTITPVDPNAQIGQRNGLSAGDIAAANSICPKGIKELPKDPGKEVPKDGRFDTRKEIIKDIRLDTRKEVLIDTRKEMIKDRFKEIAKDPIKEAAFDPPGPIQPVGPIGPLGRLVGPPGPIPFAVATGHQAPGMTAEAGGLADTAAQLDTQLQAVAEALADAEATRDALQQQYDELAALLKQALEAHDQATRG